MQLKNLMRVSPEVVAASNEETHKKWNDHANWGKTRERIVKLLDAEPGLTAKQIAFRMDYKIDSIYPTLRGYVKSKHIKQIKQDTRMRYYPKNYKLTTDKPAEVVERSQIPTPGKFTTELENRMKDYAWSGKVTGNEIKTLKDFLSWTKGEKTNG